jgi:hypothetical protein
MARATEKQIGGDHYKRLRIQPIEYIIANGLDHGSGLVLKYISRDKGGTTRRQDLEKAIHVLELMIELEEKYAR